jgi:hypothetical protein
VRSSNLPIASFSFFRLRCLSVERCLACEADLEDKAKATADKLSSNPGERGVGLPEYWSVEIL